MLTRWSDLQKSFAWMDEFRRQFEQVMENFEREFSYQGRGVPLRGSWPRVNLLDSGDKMLLQAELPGLSEKDITLSVQQDSIMFAGERQADVPEGYSVHRQERIPVKFSRSFTLPTRINPEKVTALMRDGILTVEMEKAPEAQPKQITVKAS